MVYFKPEIFEVVRLLSGIVIVPVDVKLAHVNVPTNEGDDKLALASKAVCNPLVLAIVKELLGIVTVPVDV